MSITLLAVSLSLIAISLGLFWDLRKVVLTTRALFDNEVRYVPALTSIGKEAIDSLWILFQRKREDNLVEASFAQNNWSNGVEHELFSDLLRNLVRATGASSAAIMGRIEGISSSPRELIAASGIGGDRFKRVLESIYGHFLAVGDTSVFGVRDGMSEEAVLGDFLLFGVQFSLGVPLDLGGQIDRAFLWVGFPQERYPMRVETEKIGAISREVTRLIISHRERRALSEKASIAQALAEERGEFMAHASHDLRSPLNNIRSILSLIHLEGIKEDTPKLLEVALGNCDTMAEIVDTVLEYSRYQAGDLRAKPIEVDLVHIASRVLTAHSFAAEQKGISLKLESPCDCALIKADPHHIRRVINNLVDNALKFTERGNVSISLHDSVDGRWELSVRDTGPGISPQNRDLVFLPFFRVEGVRGRGVGLGLALAKILTDMNGGNLSLYSELGSGSVFTLSFDRIQTTKQELQSVVLGTKTAQLHGRVLIVDDDLDTVHSLARILRRSSHSVLEATSVEEVRNIINKDQIDLIITDWSLPGGGGKEILKIASSCAKPIPTIVISGAGEQERSAALGLGAIAFFRKPLAIEELERFLVDCYHREIAAPLVA